MSWECLRTVETRRSLGLRDAFLTARFPAFSKDASLNRITRAITSCTFVSVGEGSVCWRCD